MLPSWQMLIFEGFKNTPEWIFFKDLVKNLISNVKSKSVGTHLYPQTPEAMSSIFLILRPAWTTEWVPGQLEVPWEILSQKKKLNRKSVLYLPPTFAKTEAWEKGRRHKHTEH